MKAAAQHKYHDFITIAVLILVSALHGSGGRWALPQLFLMHSSFSSLPSFRRSILFPQVHHTLVSSFLPTLLQVYGLAVGIPSIWVVIGFVGSIASSGVCYLFPALLMFAHGAIKGLTYTRGAGAALVFAIGAFILVNGLLNPL